MTRRAHWLVACGVLALSVLQIVLFPAESKAVMRAIYVTLWTYAPKPAGTEIPDRFK